MKHLLVPYLPLADGESTVSWACRLSLFHTGQPLVKFLHDQGIALPQLLAGKPSTFKKLAEFTGVDAQILFDHQPRQLKCRLYRFREEEFSSSFMVGTKIAFCPRCIADNDATESGLRIGKWSWLLKSTRTCAFHKTALSFLPKEKWSDLIRNLNEIGPRGDALKKALEQASPREPSPLQNYALQRLEGETGKHSWLDGQGLEQAVRASEMIGVLAKWGAKPNLHCLSEDDWDLAGRAGFQVTQFGEEEVYEFFGEVLAGFPDRTARNGPQAVFGRLYQWLQFGKTKRDPGPIQGLLRRFIVQEMAVCPGTELFGEAVKKRMRHSSQSLAAQCNVHPKTMYRALVASGLVVASELDRITGLETCDAEAGEALVEQMQRGIPVKDLPKVMNATRGQVIMLMENQFLETIFPVGSVKSRALISVDRLEVEKFLQCLTVNVVRTVVPSPGLVPIPKAAEISRRLSADIVRLLLEARLMKVDQVIGTDGYLSVLVDPDEVRCMLPVEEAVLPPSKTEAAPMLGVTPYALDAMIDNRDATPLIRAIAVSGPGPSKIRIEKSEIIKFKKEFVTLGDLKKVANQHHTVVLKNLERAGITPVGDPKKLKVYLYRRSEALPVFS